MLLKQDIWGRGSTFFKDCSVELQRLKLLPVEVSVQ